MTGIRRLGIGWWVAIGIVAFTGIAMMWPSRSEAACTVLYHGRCKWYGYFTNVLDTGGGTVLTQSAGVAIPASINTTTEFINFLKAKNATGNARDKTGSAFIYWTMIGADGAARSKTITAAQWTDLTARMNAMTINWNSSYTRANSLNSYWQGEDQGFGNDGTNNDDAYYQEDLAGENSITMTDSGGTLRYRLLRRCANPVGGSGLPAASFDIVGETTVKSGTKTATSNSGTHQITVSPGDLVTFTGFVKNNGPATAPSVIWRRVNMPSGTVMSSGGPNSYTSGQQRTVWTEANFQIPPAATNGQTFCRAAYWNPASSVNAIWQTTGQVCAVVFDPPTPQCGNYLQLAPADAPEAGDSVQFRVNVTNGSPAPLHPYVFSLAVAGPNGSWSVNGGDVTSVTYTIPVPVVSGTYTVDWNMTTASPGADSPLCHEEFTVYSKPYFRVYNGDVQAGAVFEPCSGANVPDQGDINAYNRGSADGYKGSGAQIAAMAFDNVEGFTSASLRGGVPLFPRGLSFANNSGTYGGNFNVGGCVPDFWSVAAGIQSGPRNANSLITGANGAGNGLNFTGKLDLFIDGDAYITNNVIYAGSWTVDLTTNNIPSFRLIVSGGNIYIAENVTQLDGTYVALPTNANNGIIYTCATGAPLGPPSALEVSNGCKNTLRVNGAFIARQVKLLRSNNSIGNALAAPGETMAVTRAAEIFNYSPAAWLAVPQNKPADNATYDAIVGLPPVL